MTDHLKVGVPNPVTDGGLGASEEVVQYGYFMPEKHETVDKVRTDKPRTTSDEDTLPLRRREELHGRETTQGGVRDRLGVGVVDGLRLVSVQTLGEARVVCEFFGIDFVDLFDGGREDIMRPQVERPQEVDRDFAIKTESLETNGFDFLAILVERFNLQRTTVRSTKRGTKIRGVQVLQGAIET